MNNNVTFFLFNFGYTFVMIWELTMVLWKEGMQINIQLIATLYKTSATEKNVEVP